jgi:peptidoglycan/LPS O-acetylase OafA/YrhL
MHQDASAPDREHYFWIDALRGGAAIIVLISHVSLFGLYGYEHVLAKRPPTRLLWAGHQAVILFFVISGFALYLLFEQMAAARGCWLKFIMVRLLRLYPPYLASLLLALLVLKAAHLVRIRPLTRRACHCQRSPDGGHVDRSSPDDRRIRRRGDQSADLDAGPRGKAVAAVPADLSAARDLDYLPEGPIPYAIRRTADLSLMFFVGAVVAKYRFQITRWMSTRRPSLLAALSGLAVFVFMYSFGYDWVEWMSYSVRRIAEDFTAAASAFFIALAISMPATSKRGVPGFFGKISYSLYLVHQVAIMAAVLLFYGKYPAPLMWVISIAASVGLAWVFYLAIEKPSKAASRRARLEPANNSAIRLEAKSRVTMQ